MKRPRAESTTSAIKSPNIFSWLPTATLLWTLLLAPISLAQVPGMVHTESGYDNLAGDDAICWSAPRYTLPASPTEFEGQRWKNSLVPDFIAGPTTMEANCPSGTSLSLDLKSTPTYGSDKLRTQQYYTFHLTLDIDLNSIRQQFNLAEDAFFYSHKAQIQQGKTGFYHPQIALQLEFCPINGNLCTPFMFEGLSKEYVGHLKVGTLNNRQKDIIANIANNATARLHHFEHHGSVIEYQTTSSHQDEEDHHYRNLLTTFSIIEPAPEEEKDPNNPQPPLSNIFNGSPPPLPPMQEEDTNTDEDHNIQDHIKGAAATPEFFIEIPRAIDANTSSVFQFHYDIEIQVQDPGDYLPMATVRFFLTNQTTPQTIAGGRPHPQMATCKFDLAALLHDRSITFEEPILINEVSQPAAIASYILIAACALLQIYLLGTTIRHRNENVLQLSQVGFLIVLQGAALVAICATVLFQPFHTVACYLRGPLKFIPLQLIFAIVYGRLRRIYVIMAPLLSFSTGSASDSNMKRGFQNWRRVMMNMSGTASNSEYQSSCSRAKSSSAGSDDNNPGTNESASLKCSFWGRICPRKCRSFRPRGSLRQEFSQTRLALLVALVTLPMVVWEICLIVFFPPDLHLVLNEDESVGRYECGTELNQKWQLASPAIMFLTILLDLYQAQSTKSLPAFFNETAAVSNGLALSLCITAIGFAVLLVSDGPEASVRNYGWLIVVSYMHYYG